MQTRVDSFMEAVTNTIIGLAISTVANWTVTPAILGHTITLTQNVALSAAFTVISIVRSYTLRRTFDGRTPWQALKAWGAYMNERVPCPSCFPLFLTKV